MKTAGRVFSVMILSLFVLAGCHELGHLDGVGDYRRADDHIVGEVRYVDTRDREIDIRSDRGRTWRVRYDNRTRVSYREKEYSVGDLEPGDYVALRTRQDRDGRLYTDLVTVRENVRDRGRASRVGRLENFEGTVEYIDSERGMFEVRNRDNRLVVVTLPYNPSRLVSNQFRRLRQGDYVKIEGRFLNRDRFELEAFT